MLSKSKNNLYKFLHTPIILILTIAGALVVAAVITVVVLNPFGSKSVTIYKSNLISKQLTTVISNETVVNTSPTVLSSSTTSSEASSTIVSSKLVVIAVKSITLSKSSATLTKGTKLTLKATISPANSTDTTITWSSSNRYVASVSQCVVTAVGGGSCVIKVTSANGTTAKCNITVKQKTPTTPVGSSSTNESPIGVGKGVWPSVPQISGTATGNYSTDIKTLIKQLGLTPWGTGILYNPLLGKDGAGDSFCFGNGEKTANELDIYYWNGSPYETIYYKIRPMALQIIKFYFPTSYSTVFDDIDTIYDGTNTQKSSIINHTFKIEGKSVSFSFEGSTLAVNW